MNNATPPAHPGVILLEKAMKPLGVSRNKLARDIDVPVGRISDIVSGKRGVSPDTALRLAKYFGTSAEMWMRLQWEYDLYVARVTVWPRIDPRVRVFEPSEEGLRVSGREGGRAPEPILPDLPDPVLRRADETVHETDEAPPGSDSVRFEIRNGAAFAAPERPERHAPVDLPLRLDSYERVTDVAVAERPTTAMPTPPHVREPAAAAVATIARQAAAVMAAVSAVREVVEPEVDHPLAEADTASERSPYVANEPAGEIDAADEADIGAFSPRTAFDTLAAEGLREWTADATVAGLDTQVDVPEPDGQADEPLADETERMAAGTSESASFEPTYRETETSATPSALDADPPHIRRPPFGLQADHEVEPSSTTAALGNASEFTTPAIFADVNGAGHRHPERGSDEPDATQIADGVEPLNSPELLNSPDLSAGYAPIDVPVFEEFPRRNAETVEADALDAAASAPPPDPMTDALAESVLAPTDPDIECTDPRAEPAPLTLVDEVEPPLLEDVEDDEPLLLTEELPSLDIPDPDEARYRVRRGVD